MDYILCPNSYNPINYYSMFNFFKKNKNKDILNLLSDQVIGGQSIFFKIFKQVIKENEENINKIELTYFALSTMGYFYLRLSKSKQKEDIFDQVSLIVLENSLPYSDKNKSIKSAVAEYQKRYIEYAKLINLAFNKESLDSHEYTTLLMYVYECVTRKSPKDKMIEITLASSLIAQYLVDHIDFIKQKVRE